MHLAPPSPPVVAVVRHRKGHSFQYVGAPVFKSEQFWLSGRPRDGVEHESGGGSDSGCGFGCISGAEISIRTASFTQGVQI